MDISFGDPIIVEILKNDDLEKHYSADCLPPNLTEPTTDKSNRCLFEEIDSTIYETEARMIAYRTTFERIQAWLKALHIYFYDIMGKQNDKNVSWVDTPSTISSHQPLQKVTIEVKNLNNERIYKVTFFIKSELIQVQGTCHNDFAVKDFPIILRIVHKICGPLKTLQESDTEQKHEETNPKIIVTSSNNSQSLRAECISFNKSTETQVGDVANIQRLESVFAESFLKLEKSVATNTEKIQKTLTDIDNKLCDKKQEKSKELSGETIHTPQNKIRTIRDEKTHLEVQIQLEKSNAALREEQLEKLLVTEKNILQATREQLTVTISNAREEQDVFSRQIKDKNDEIDRLNNSLKELSMKLDNARDEIIQMKIQFSGSVHQPQFQSGMQDIDSHQRPTVLLIGTSNVEGTKEDKLSSSVGIHKIIKYTIKDTSQYLSSVVDPPTLIVLHSLTNDLRSKTPQACVDSLFQLTSEICSKWPLIKIVISLTTPRCDDMNHSTNGQIINALLKQKFTGENRITLADHNNMLVHGNPNQDVLRDDGVHLNDKGLSLLAVNLKRAIHSMLNIPLPIRHPRSASRGRKPQSGRGRGNGKR